MKAHILNLVYFSCVKFEYFFLRIQLIKKKLNFFKAKRCHPASPQVLPSRCAEWKVAPVPTSITVRTVIAKSCMVCRTYGSLQRVLPGWTHRAPSQRRTQKSCLWTICGWTRWSEVMWRLWVSRGSSSGNYFCLGFTGFQCWIGNICKQKIKCGAPQGFVLGPLSLSSGHRDGSWREKTPHKLSLPHHFYPLICFQAVA